MTKPSFYEDKPGDGQPRVLEALPGAAHTQFINPSALFDGSSIFTQVIVTPPGHTVWISGQIGCNADNQLVSDGFEEQLSQAFKNLRNAIAAAKVEPRHVVRICEYIVDHKEAYLPPLIAEIQGLFRPGPYPTNTIVPVPRLGRDKALFEIDAMAVVPADEWRE